MACQINRCNVLFAKYFISVCIAMLMLLLKLFGDTLKLNVTMTL